MENLCGIRGCRFIRRRLLFYRNDICNVLFGKRRRSPSAIGRFNSCNRKILGCRIGPAYGLYCRPHTAKQVRQKARMVFSVNRSYRSFFYAYMVSGAMGKPSRQIHLLYTRLHHLFYGSNRFIHSLRRFKCGNYTIVFAAK